MAISPQLVEHSRAFREERQLPFEVLSDPGNRTAGRYGLAYTMPEDLREVYLAYGLDVPAHNGEKSWTLPMPGRFLVDAEGIVRYAEASPDYRVRPEPEETLRVLLDLR